MTSKASVVVLLVTLGLNLSFPVAVFELPGTEVVMAPDASRLLASQSTFNASALWDNVWGSVSQDEIGNLTRVLSETYANRTWDNEEMSPTDNLRAAWDWANQTMEINTNGDLHFDNITDYHNLIAIKQGSLPSPAPAIVITGMIDSEATSGANDAGASAAVVLEIARVLNNYTFSCDVYYVLTNGAHVGLHYNPGARELVAWFEDNEIETITTLSFDRLLFHRVDITNGALLSLRTSPDTELYQESHWFPDVMMRVASDYGNGRLQEAIDLGVTERSTAFEMWQTGRPAVHISQGFYYDFYSGTVDDTWDNSFYNFGKAAEIAAAVAGAVAYVGILGYGEPASFYLSGRLDPGNSTSQDLVITFNGYVNATVIWNGTVPLQTSVIFLGSAAKVYERLETDNFISVKYLSGAQGNFRVNITNLGVNSTFFGLNVTYINDCDGDTLSDISELFLGTDVYSTDSDRDGLPDDFELGIGTDPTSEDSDGDGASDWDEYLWGSSLLQNDTDLDGLLDGQEAALGTDPTDEDTDSDGVNDFLEVMTYGTNPVSSDTDSDGLEDGFEIEGGLNPLSPDSDGDGLGDLFEVLNLLDPLSVDTDNDGWSDAYEVEFCMSPISTDTDADGIPDGIDWDPQEHWISMVAPVVLLTIVILFVIFSFMKFGVYKKAN
jgi:hypothetical protein